MDIGKNYPSVPVGSRSGGCGPHPLVRVHRDVLLGADFHLDAADQGGGQTRLESPVCPHIRLLCSRSQRTRHYAAQRLLQSGSGLVMGIEEDRRMKTAMSVGRVSNGSDCLTVLAESPASRKQLKSTSGRRASRLAVHVAADETYDNKNRCCSAQEGLSSKTVDRYYTVSRTVSSGVPTALTAFLGRGVFCGRCGSRANFILAVDA